MQGAGGSTSIQETVTVTNESHLRVLRVKMLAPGDRRHGRHEFSRINRLGQVRLKAAAQCPLAVFRACVGRQGGGRYFANGSLGPLPNAVDQFKAIHSWQSNVRDDHTWGHLL